MMAEINLEFHVSVQPEWVDYNGHMNDAAYAKVFSLAADDFIEAIGLAAEARKQYSYTMFTLETHLCYLKEAHEGERLSVSHQLLDSDAKRLHVFLKMENAAGDVVATSEQMLMGMDVEQGRPAPFPKPIAEIVEKLQSKHKELDLPKQAGRTIGFRR